MQEGAVYFDESVPPLPKKGDRIERLHPTSGALQRGTVYYVDQLQILVKWDDDGSASLRTGIDSFRIIESE
jgi:hypothetical protein